MTQIEARRAACQVLGINYDLFIVNKLELLINAELLRAIYGRLTKSG